MAQIKIYGVDTHLETIKEQLSNVIHSCIVEALKLPEDKRFHRFFPMKAEDMFYPNNRSYAYTIIEILITETPAYHFGFRGMSGDEMLLDYKVEV